MTMKHKTTTFFLERVSFGRYVDFFVRLGDGRSGFQRMLPATFEHMEEGDDNPAEPSLRVLPESAQQLMDQLWAIGFRPTQGQQSEGQFAAQGKHLADMRALAAHALKAQLPGA
jgi:hypothetical protein